MQIILNPERSAWPDLLRRPANDTASIEKQVAAILNRVRSKGDVAVRKYTKTFDGARMRNYQVADKEFNKARKSLDPALRNAIDVAIANIKKFHSAQLHKGEEVETMPGVRCYRRALPIDNVGLYVPGGTAPLFSSLLMLGIPATLAGCRNIILCTPPDKEGNIHPAMLYAAASIGISRLFKVGGVQAIGAMAYGTESVPRVHKLFGPGNRYVTLAKQLVQKEGTAIDMPAGPSEVCVLADDTAHPAYVAADLLSQAEHGPDSQVLLVTTSSALVLAVNKELDLQLEKLPRKEIARQALQNSKALVMVNPEIAMDLVNTYAPEHLIIACQNYSQLASLVRNAGSVFLGNFTPESVGDYASGTNHTLPTHGHAMAYSGVSVDSFMKKVTFQELTPAGLQNIASTVITMAESEGLQAHAEAVRIRIK